MTWAVKLKEKAFAVYLNAELYVGDILKIEGKKVILVDDFRKAVLEKNKELVEDARSQFEFSTKQENQSPEIAGALVKEILKDELARAFRELVEACSKASGDTRKGIEEMEKVKK